MDAAEMGCAIRVGCDILLEDDYDDMHFYSSSLSRSEGRAPLCLHGRQPLLCIYVL